MCKAEFYTDPDLLQLPRDVRTFYRDLWHVTEDSGCLEDSPFGLKITLYPSPLDSDATVESIAGWRDALLDAGKLTRYEVDGKPYLFVTNFLTHQTLTNSGVSDVPIPPWVTLEQHHTDKRKRSYKVTGEIAEVLSNGTATVALPGREEKRRELKGREEDQESGPDSDESAPTDSPKAVKVKAPDWQSKADALLEKSRFPSDLMQLSEILAAENKTGKVALSRVVSQLYEPLVALQSELSDAALRHGLRAAITNMAPNANYVRKAALKYVPCATASAAKPTTDYDDLLEG
jgi:hypothetical protein